MNCNNYFDMTDQGDSFESWQGLRGPAGPQGPAGAPGAPGTSVELRGPVETTGDLPATASSSELWLVGSAAPYHGWFYNGSSWEDAGEIAVGPTGPRGPAGADGTDGSDGVTFTPTVSSAGVISWTNDGSLPNPDPVDIKGPQGPQGETGATGPQGPQGATGQTGPQGPQGATGQTGPAGQDGTDGSNGATFTPSVSSAGVISWTNDGGLPNPESVNIKGPQGATGATGPQGPQGETGATGPAGPGVPAGGTAGQVLTKTGAADYATGWQDPSGGDVTADMLGIVINGNSTPVGASAGQYVIVKNSTITGITDGLYKAGQAIPANTAIDSTYLTTASNGGLNDLLSRTQWVRIWTNASPNSSFAAQDVAVPRMAEFDEYRIQLSDYMDSSAPSFQLVIAGYGKGEQWCFNSVKFHYRAITTTASGVTFTDSTTFSTYGSPAGAVNNSYLIPWYIEGKKN